MSNVSHDVGTCNIKPNQHQVDDLFWQADEHEQLAQLRERSRTEARERAIASELVALWARSRELMTELLSLWTTEGAQEEAPPTLRSPSDGAPLAEVTSNAGWSAFACGESYLGSQSEREREAWADWRSEVGWVEPSEVGAP